MNYPFHILAVITAPLVLALYTSADAQELLGARVLAVYDLRVKAGSDLNNDSRDDIALTGLPNGQALVLSGDTLNTIFSTTASDYNIPFSGLDTPAVADLNRDGVADLVLALNGIYGPSQINGGAVGVDVLHNQTIFAKAANTMALGPVVAGDFSGLGVIEVVSPRYTSTTGSSFQVLFPNGNVRCTSPAWQGHSSYRSVNGLSIVPDLTGDGVKDIVVSHAALFANFSFTWVSGASCIPFAFYDEEPFAYGNSLLGNLYYPTIPNYELFFRYRVGDTRFIGSSVLEQSELKFQGPILNEFTAELIDDVNGDDRREIAVGAEDGKSLNVVSIAADGTSTTLHTLQRSFIENLLLAQGSTSLESYLVYPVESQFFDANDDGFYDQVIRIVNPGIPSPQTNEVLVTIAWQSPPPPTPTPQLPTPTPPLPTPTPQVPTPTPHSPSATPQPTVVSTFAPPTGVTPTIDRKELTKLIAKAQRASKSTTPKAARTLLNGLAKRLKTLSAAATAETQEWGVLNSAAGLAIKGSKKGTPLSRMRTYAKKISRLLSSLS